MFAGYFSWLNYLPTVVSVIFAGIAIKLLDDYLDQESPEDSYLISLFDRSGYAYGLVFLLIAAGADLHLTFSLFAASYSVGMFTSSHDKLPTGLSSWVESIVAVIFAILVSGWQMALWAIVTIVTVQLLDDLVDYKHDSFMGHTSIARSLGIERTIVLLLLAGYISLRWQIWLGLFIIIISQIISFGLMHLNLRRNADA